MAIDIQRLREYSKDISLLYVEDDDDLRTITEKIFERLFLRVDTACDGDKGYEAWKLAYDSGTHYDLIITDISMPKLNGIDLCKKILELVPDQKIVIMSAHNDVEYLQQAIDLGISGFITKPFNNDHLFRLLFNVCGAIFNTKKYTAYVKQIEEQNRILRSQKYSEKLGTMQDEFLRNISHEIKTPLNSILGFSSILRKYVDIGDKRVADFFEILEQNAKAIEVLTNRMLQLSRLRSGTFDMVIKNHSIKPLLDHLLESYAMKAQHTGITFQSQIDEVLDHPLECDWVSINTIVTELCDNAIKFGKPNGNISLRIGFDQGKGALTMDIKDDGMGIDPQEHNKIFDMFYQVDGSLTRTAEGAGIGLSLVRYMCDLSGGNVWVESAIGEGSQFHVTLPLGEAVFAH